MLSMLFGNNYNNRSLPTQNNNKADDGGTSSSALTASAADDDDKEPASLEVDYDHNCTRLFKSLMNQSWDICMTYMDNGIWPGSFVQDPFPPSDQARTWVTRYSGHNKDNDNNNKSNDFLWSTLPLHIAIIKGAPYNIIERLVELYPDSVRCMDDQSMLPLHLARVYGSSKRVIELLYNAYPVAAAATATVKNNKKNKQNNEQVVVPGVVADEDDEKDENEKNPKNPTSIAKEQQNMLTTSMSSRTMMDESILEKDQYCAEDADSINNNPTCSQMQRSMAKAAAATAASTTIQEIRNENAAAAAAAMDHSCCFGTDTAAVVAGDYSTTSSISRTTSSQQQQQQQLLQQVQQDSSRNNNKTIAELQQKFLEIESSSQQASRSSMQSIKEMELLHHIQELERQVQSWKYAAWNSRVAAIKAEFTAVRIKEQLKLQQIQQQQQQQQLRQQQQQQAAMNATRQQGGAGGGTTRDDKESKREGASLAEGGGGCTMIQTSSSRTMESNYEEENVEVRLHSNQYHGYESEEEEEFVGVEVSMLLNKYPMRTAVQQNQQPMMMKAKWRNEKKYKQSLRKGMEKNGRH